MSWFKREENEIVNDARKTVRTEGLWTQCGSCRQAIFQEGSRREPECVPEVRLSLSRRRSTPN